VFISIELVDWLRILNASSGAHLLLDHLRTVAFRGRKAA
jgi:hypothetical protein